MATDWGGGREGSGGNNGNGSGCPIVLVGAVVAIALVVKLFRKK